MSETGGETPDGPIEAYLDQLVTELSGHPPRELRRMLAEAEAHLYEDAEAARARGVSEREAEAQAVASFGSAGHLAAAERTRLLTPLGVLIRQTLGSALLLGGIGAVGVGVSGLIAAVIRVVGGATFLAGPAPGQPQLPSDCARWLSLDPTARTCAAAATADWAAEDVYYRIAAGILGLVALLAFRWLTRRAPRMFALSTLNPVVSDTVAATMFAAAAVWTLGLGIDAVAVASGNGAGQWFSAAPVALAAAAVFSVRLIRTLRTAVPI